jgi:pimeloyl-ACP methyl ester carboxylesterase
MSAREHPGWTLVESGSPDADHSLLLLPGGFCTAAVYDDLVAQPKLRALPVRLIATTPPGFGRNPPPRGFDFTVEGYAELAADVAANLGCDVVVGHSYGANVAIEMAVAGHFSGILVLLSPSFSSEDESRSTRMFDSIGRVPGLGRVTWALVFRMLSRLMRGRLPPDRHDALVAEIMSSDARIWRTIIRRYFEYLERNRSLVSRLCAAGAPTWVVRGDHDEIGLTDDERDALVACPTVTMVTVPEAGHLVLTDQPGRVAELIVEVLSSR